MIRFSHRSVLPRALSLILASQLGCGEIADTSESPTTAGPSVTGDETTGSPTTAETGLDTIDAAADSTSSSTSEATSGESSSDATTGVSEPGAADLASECFMGTVVTRVRLLLDAPLCDAGWPDVTLRVDLFSPVALEPGTYALGPGLGLALLVDAGSPDPTVNGSITLDGVDADAVHGSYILEFAEHGTLTGSFAGPVCATRPSCDGAPAL